MPIILEDNAAQGSAQAVKAVRPDYGPKDYNSILTGNGINQGLLRSTLLANGSDPISNMAVTIMMNERRQCTNKAHHVHDDLRTYTVLHQDISICGGFGPAAAKNPSLPMPLKLMDDSLISFEDAKGNLVEVKSRLFINRLYVYKGVANYVLCSYSLLAADGSSAGTGWAETYDSLYAPAKYADPIGELYARLAVRIRADMAAKGFAPVIDSAAAQAEIDKARSIYDIVMSELEIIKTPGKLRYAMETASAAGYDVLSYANNVLNLITIPFTLYRSDVIDVVHARTREEATRLMNANMSLSLADTLGAMQGKLSTKIPELTGKKYSTQAITLTTEQTAAIESDDLVTIVAAGAGTGKSSCVTHRLAFMSENGCNMAHTFVLSFTKAAAGHIRKQYKQCRSSTIAEFTHDFVDMILKSPGVTDRVSIVAHSDFAQKLRLTVEGLEAAGLLVPSTLKALKNFLGAVDNIETRQAHLLDMLDTTLNPEANNILSVLKRLRCTSLEIDPIIFHAQLGVIHPNIEHIVIDESQDSNRLEFLTMLKMALMNGISLYIVGKA